MESFNTHPTSVSEPLPHSTRHMPLLDEPSADKADVRDVRFQWSATMMMWISLSLVVQMVASRGFLLGEGMDGELKLPIAIAFMVANSVLWAALHVYRRAALASTQNYDGSWLFNSRAPILFFHSSFLFVQLVLAVSTFNPDLSHREGKAMKSLKFLSYDVVAFQAIAIYLAGCSGCLWMQTNANRLRCESALNRAEQSGNGTRALVSAILRWEERGASQRHKRALFLSFLVALVPSVYSFAFAVRRGLWTACVIAWPSWYAFWVAIAWYFSRLHERYACVARWLFALNAMLDEAMSNDNGLPCQLASVPIWFEARRCLMSEYAGLEYARCARAVAINLAVMTICVLLVAIHTLLEGPPKITMATLFENDTCYYVIMCESVLFVAAGTMIALLPCSTINAHLAKSLHILKAAYHLQTIRCGGIEENMLVPAPVWKSMVDHMGSELHAPTVLGMRVTPVVYRIVTTYAFSGGTYICLSLSQVITAHVGSIPGLASNATM